MRVLYDESTPSRLVRLSALAWYEQTPRAFDLWQALRTCGASGSLLQRRLVRLKGQR